MGASPLITVYGFNVFFQRFAIGQSLIAVVARYGQVVVKTW